MGDLLANQEKLTRTDSVGKKRVRLELDEFTLDSPDVKRLRDDLFDDSGHAQTIHDLDSVMKSFEDELLTTTTQGSGDCEIQPDLGYLFEASDDELGLPPPPPQPMKIPTPFSEETEETVTELVRASSASSELCAIDDHATGFGSFDLDDGLFEYSDGCLDSGDLFSWPPEFLPAE